MITPTEHNIIISPVESQDSDVSNLIGNEIYRAFGFKTEIVSLLNNLDFAFDADRKQHYSTLILEKLAGLAPDRAIKVIAVTRVDLFIPILTHVYGEAQLGGKACIVSTHRLKEGLPMGDRDTFTNRVVKEAVHELGHTFNLRHCQDHACIMHYCRCIGDVDRKTDRLCRYCRILLADELTRMSLI